MWWVLEDNFEVKEKKEGKKSTTLIRPSISEIVQSFHFAYAAVSSENFIDRFYDSRRLAK